MIATLNMTIDAWPNGGPIPDAHAFCVPAPVGHVAPGRNRNPEVRWSAGPSGTKSFALICHDPDVPSRGDDVNQEGKIVSARLPRVVFHHWVLVDIPAVARQVPGGADSDGVTPRGKPPGRTPHGVRGLNDYTGWFASDPEMSGDYAGYDGPCPPWNDEIVHHYHFTLHALDVESLGLGGRFTARDARQAMEGHVLAEEEWIGTYTLNPSLRMK